MHSERGLEMDEYEAAVFSDATSPQKSDDVTPQPMAPVMAAPRGSDEDDEFVEVVNVMNVDEEEEEEEDEMNEMDAKRKRRRERKREKKRKKKKKKKRKKKRHRNAVQKEEFEYEPDFVSDLEGTAANHHPPQHVMGVSPQELAEQVAKDQAEDDQKGNDVQSTVSSHPAFDAKNLKHFMDLVEEQEHGVLTVTGRREHDYKEDDEESMSSGTSNSSNYSYSTSNEAEYIPNDAISLASADHQQQQQPLAQTLIHHIGPIKEDQVLLDHLTPIHDDDDTPFGDAVDGDDHEEPENTQFLKALYDEMHSEQDGWNEFESDVYGLILSFMGRHDRWLHCRLVCKAWNALVYDRYWIFPEYLTLDEVKALKPGRN